VGQFEQDGRALVWRRETQGCAVAMGWATALFGLLWGGGGVLGFVRSGEPLGLAFAVLGAMTLLFGLVLATLRSEVRVDATWAVIRRSAVVTLSSVTVPVRGSHAVAAVRNLVAMPRAPQTVGPRQYAPSVSVGLVTPQGFVPLATELEGPASEASVRGAMAALSAVTGLPAEDRRTSAQPLLAELGAWRNRNVLPIVLGTLAFVLVLALVVAAAVFSSSGRAGDGGGGGGGGAGDTAPTEMPRGRGRRRG